ncbi:45018_t:CDS:1, partial [Gigaspora margarita]
EVQEILTQNNSLKKKSYQSIRAKYEIEKWFKSRNLKIKVTYRGVCGLKLCFNKDGFMAYTDFTRIMDDKFLNINNDRKIMF